jgi:predicted nucleic acid-binding protein
MANKPKVYFDACCFIDLVKKKKGIPLIEPDREEHVDFCKRLIKACRDDKIEIHTSYLTNLECLFLKDEQRRKLLDDEIKRLFDSIILSGESGIIPIESSYIVFEKAKELSWLHGIIFKGAMDSIHIASALLVGCDEFITTDRKSFESIKESIERLGIKIIFHAKDTKCLPKEYMQEGLNFNATTKKEE